MVTEKLRQLIEDQQKGHEKEDIFMVGMQLLDIAEREPASAEILLKDLSVPEMGLEAAAGRLKAYANANKGKKSFFCITPIVAEGILRDFYGLPTAEKAEEKAEPTPPKPQGFIDLDDFL